MPSTSPDPIWLGAPANTADPTTALVLTPDPDGLPAITWVGPAGPGLSAADLLATIGVARFPASAQGTTGRALPLLPEMSRAWLGRTGLSGHRLGDGSGGRDWSPRFVTTHVDADARGIGVEAVDDGSGLGLRTEIEAVPGGALRLRHSLTNVGADPFVVDALDVIVPVADRAVEQLDMTGRWGRERSPQRRVVGDGLWLRETRGGRSGPDSPTLLTVGTAGFGFGHGDVWGIHLGWSGGTRHFVERLPSGLVTLGAGEVLLPGEMVLAAGDSYATPWVYVVAAQGGLDALSVQLHRFQRSLPAHPVGPKPVTLNVWEAVYFDHDLERLRHLARCAAEVGIERFVLDDGWFGGRRDDRAGLGDWVVSDDAWPAGLSPLIDSVQELGMDFGIWLELEMVNPDSELFRAHPEWVLATAGREPLLFRNQLVLDLGRAEVRDHLFAQVDQLLSRHPIAFVKWDHNRNLIDASGRDGRAGVHAQTLGFYDLLDRLRTAHPGVAWESCASGGARIDLGVIERVERFWTSDMTDALARQAIQRWTGQLIAPEYLGAHVSAPVNHQTGRTLSLDLRAATALFGDFGVEWDLTSAGADDRARLGHWITAYKDLRGLLHSGRTVRVDSPLRDVWTYGVLADDRSQAVIVCVQFDEFVADPPGVLVPGLDPARQYTAHRVGPPTLSYGRSEVSTDWSGEGLRLSGAVLGQVGLPAAPRQPQSALVIHLTAD